MHCHEPITTTANDGGIDPCELFTSRLQVYSLSQQFLPKDWIMERWEEGYYITGMAGSISGASLVVMSKVRRR